MSSSGYPAFEELASSPRLVVSAGDHQVQRRFKVGWSDLDNFIYFLSTGGLGETPSWYPTLEHLCIREITAEPYGGDDVSPDAQVIVNPSLGVNTYSVGNRRGALVTVTYGILPYSRPWPTTVPKPTIPDGTYLRLTTRTSGQFLTFPGRTGAWTGDTLESTVFSQSPSSSSSSSSSSDSSSGSSSGIGTYRSTENAILLPVRDIRLEWYGLSDPPVGNMDLYVGRVNTFPFLGGAAGTVLFEGHELDEDYGLNIRDPFRWKATLQFRQRVRLLGYTSAGAKVWVTWNHDYRPSVDGTRGGWSYVTLSSGEPRYRSGDLAELFVI